MKVPYRVADTYVEPEGKFNSAYGSAAIIDCNYLLDNVIRTIKMNLEEYEYEIPPELYEEIMKRI